MSRISLPLLFMGIILLQSGCNLDREEPVQKEQKQHLTTMDEVDERFEMPEFTIMDGSEYDLVEQVVFHRKAYHESLKALEQYYRDHGFGNKALWAQAELKDVNRIKPFNYILDSEVPGLWLRPTESIPQADAMYEKAMKKLVPAGHGTPALYSEKKMSEVLKILQDLIRDYPTSDKIDDSAFYCGEIYKEYFKNQEEIAIEWYERAWTWNPETPHPARFQAAAVTDLRLHDRARALELYKAVLEHEPDNRSNVAFSVRRIEELSKPE